MTKTHACRQRPEAMEAACSDGRCTMRSYSRAARDSDPRWFNKARSFLEANWLPVTLMIVMATGFAIKHTEPPALSNPHLGARITLPSSTQNPEAFKADITIRADQPGATISRNIYGSFSEHLGSGIYDGIWVGEDSPIPNTRGIRNDAIAALKKLNLGV